MSSNKQSTVLYWLRWLSVFHGALASGFLATFPLHWVLQFIFTTARGEEPALGSLRFFLNLLHLDNANSVEYLLYPAIIATTFIIVGYKIAPRYKFKTAVVLFGIYTITWIVISLITLFDGVDKQFSVRTILALMGAILGLYGAKKSTDIKAESKF